MKYICIKEQYSLKEFTERVGANVNDIGDVHIKLYEVVELFILKGDIKGKGIYCKNRMIDGGGALLINYSDTDYQNYFIPLSQFREDRINSILDDYRDEIND